MNIRPLAIPLALAGLAIGASTLGASAAVVCSGNTCWHTTEQYDYPSSARVIVHPDDWRWGENEHYAWREHPGRGYWREDQWSDF